MCSDMRHMNYVAFAAGLSPVKRRAEKFAKIGRVSGRDAETKARG